MHVEPKYCKQRNEWNDSVFRDSKQASMTSQIFAQPFSSLRVITQRLSSATTQQLPQLAHDLTSQFSLCGKELKASGQAQSNGVSSEVTIHVVKLKTQLSTLLLDKTPDARYAAVILIKATIEAGGWSILPHSGLWARNLVSILEVSTPVAFSRCRLQYLHVL